MPSRSRLRRVFRQWSMAELAGAWIEVRPGPRSLHLRGPSGGPASWETPTPRGWAGRRPLFDRRESDPPPEQLPACSAHPEASAVPPDPEYGPAGGRGGGPATPTSRPAGPADPELVLFGTLDLDDPARDGGACTARSSATATSCWSRAARMARTVPRPSPARDRLPGAPRAFVVRRAAWSTRRRQGDPGALPALGPTGAARRRRARAASARCGRAARGGRPPALRIDHRAHQADVGGGKGVGLAQLAQRDVLGRPLADPGSARKRGDRLVEVGAGAKIADRPRRRAPGGQRRAARPRHAEGRDIGAASRSRSGKTCVSPSLPDGAPVRGSP